VSEKIINSFSTVYYFTMMSRQTEQWFRANPAHNMNAHIAEIHNQDTADQDRGVEFLHSSP
jgi:hypothetical protein